MCACVYALGCQWRGLRLSSGAILHCFSTLFPECRSLRQIQSSSLWLVSLTSLAGESLSVSAFWVWNYVWATRSTKGEIFLIVLFFVFFVACWVSELQLSCLCCKHYWVFSSAPSDMNFKWKSTIIFLSFLSGFEHYFCLPSFHLAEPSSFCCLLLSWRSLQGCLTVVNAGCGLSSTEPALRQSTVKGNEQKCLVRIATTVLIFLHILK